MTNYEKIVGMSVEDMTSFLAKCDTNHSISDSLYCRICEHHVKGTYHCDVPDNKELPCMDLTDEECVRRWLEHEI